MGSSLSLKEDREKRGRTEKGGVDGKELKGPGDYRGRGEGGI